MARYQVQTGDGRLLPDLTATVAIGAAAPLAEDDTLAGAQKKARAAAVACLAAQILVVDTQSAGAVVQQIPAGG